MIALLLTMPCKCLWNVQIHSLKTATNMQGKQAEFMPLASSTLNKVVNTRLRQWRRSVGCELSSGRAATSLQPERRIEPGRVVGRCCLAETYPVV